MEITSGPSVEIELAGAKVAIPSNIIAKLWLELVRGGRPTVVAAINSPPSIGSAWEGGTYMGVVRGDKGPDHHLIDLGEATKSMTHEEATKWAKDMGGSLPTRREQAVMFGNCGDGQYQQAWYWSCEQFAGGGAFAWVQDFDDGGQILGLKSLDYRARAVRRLTIQ